MAGFGSSEDVRSCLDGSNMGGVRTILSTRKGSVESRADHEDSDVVVVILHRLVEGLSASRAPPPNEPIVHGGAGHARE